MQSEPIKKAQDSTCHQRPLGRHESEQEEPAHNASPLSRSTLQLNFLGSLIGIRKQLNIIANFLAAKVSKKSLYRNSSI